jgi:signal transduction histidine kinase/DNA-binding response OmpR family regulator
VAGERILIADDMQDVLDLCTRILTQEGYEVSGVRNGHDAVALAETQCFDLFLTDLMMPGIKGIDTAQAIRKILPDCVIVVMTGFGTMDTAIEALRLGFSEFIVKPFKPNDLRMAVSRALERARLRRENERLRALVPLFELNKHMMATIEEEELATQVLHTACEELEIERGVLMLQAADRPGLYVKAFACADGSPLPSSLSEQVLRFSEQLLGQREQVVFEAAAAPSDVVELMQQLDTERLMFNPLLALDTPVGGILLCASGDGTVFTRSDRELLSVLCGQAAIALQNAHLFQQIQHAYDELRTLDHMKSEFINIAAHELRTPLAILMGHAELLLTDVEDVQTQERLQIIVRNAVRLRNLIDALLDMRHLQRGESLLVVQPFDVRDLIEDVLQDFVPTARSKAIEISVVVPPDLPPVESDREKVMYTLTNLVDNAIRFTPSTGKVGIDVVEDEGEIQVSVWDTGVGIASEEVERIFQPFYQIEASLTREHEGLGLGLAIAKGMVERIGGRIWVESKPEKGSRFTFTIPSSPPLSSFSEATQRTLDDL